MNTLSKKERFWGCLAHVPIITIIWSSYLIYRFINNGGFTERLLSLHSLPVTSLPVTPLFLTVLSIPVSLIIRALQKKSSFVRDNAQSALVFNIWLLECYALSFVIAAVGIYSGIKLLVLAAGMVVFLLSGLCLVQSIMGIFTALSGTVFYYWRP